MVPVRPDWSDSSDLFGHLDLNGQFIPGELIEFIKDAQIHTNRPYILCLDEMNLARVEYYFSDFLSIIETRDFDKEIIKSNPLISMDKYGADNNAKNIYVELGFPQNLYIIGTVNMDETTFPFSKKVLDRANTIEFNYVDLMTKARNSEVINPIIISNDFLRSDYIHLSECSDEEYISEICLELNRINVKLAKANAHIGYRIRDEIVFYMLYNKNMGLLNEYDALDNEILQKILPRIQGSSYSIKMMLCELFNICAEDYNQRSGDTDSEKMRKVLDDSTCVCKYKKCAEKIQLMVQRFEEDGFTSYWL